MELLIMMLGAANGNTSNDAGITSLLTLDDVSYQALDNAEVAAYGESYGGYPVQGQLCGGGWIGNKKSSQGEEGLAGVEAQEARGGGGVAAEQGAGEGGGRAEGGADDAAAGAQSDERRSRAQARSHAGSVRQLSRSSREVAPKNITWEGGGGGGYVEIDSVP